MCPTFFSLLSSIGELAVPAVASPNKKHSLVISSWVEREEPRWGSTWRSDKQVQDTTINNEIAKRQANWNCHQNDTPIPLIGDLQSTCVMLCAISGLKGKRLD